VIRLHAEPRRTKLIAAITDDSAATAVLSTSSAIAGLFSATVEAVHVGEQQAAVTDAARDAGVALSTVAGGAVEGLQRAAAAEDVAAVVIGARGTTAGERPTGSTAMALITSIEKPVAVVPPNTTVRHRIESVLLPMNGTPTSAAAAEEIVKLSSNAELRIVVAHVYQEGSLPAFSDHLPHEVRAWSEEFIARHCPEASEVRLELRVGEPHEHVLEILRKSDCDLVVLGWSQDLAEGHAAVVRRMLAESPVPVLLVPVSQNPELALAGPDAAETTTGGRA
jgi:nucleotide-binding universal stress UspA family protein